MEWGVRFCRQLFAIGQLAHTEIFRNVLLRIYVVTNTRLCACAQRFVGKLYLKNRGFLEACINCVMDRTPQTTMGSAVRRD